MVYHNPQASSNESRPDQFGADAGNPVNSRRTQGGLFSNPAALLGRHLDCLASNSFTGANGSHPPTRSLDETLDLLDGLNCEVSGATLSTAIELKSLTPCNHC